MLSKPIKTDPEFLALLKRSAEAFNAMSPEEQEHMLRLQRESWVRGEMGIGNDADEAAAREAYRAGGAA